MFYSNRVQVLHSLEVFACPVEQLHGVDAAMPASGQVVSVRGHQVVDFGRLASVVSQVLVGQTHSPAPLVQLDAGVYGVFETAALYGG